MAKARRGWLYGEISDRNLYMVDYRLHVGSGLRGQGVIRKMNRMHLDYRDYKCL